MRMGNGQLFLWNGEHVRVRTTSNTYRKQNKRGTENINQPIQENETSVATMIPSGRDDEKAHRSVRAVYPVFHYALLAPEGVEIN